MVARKKRRYTRYTQDDVYRALDAHQDHLQVRIVPGSSYGNRITLATSNYGEVFAVVLARSSDWYRYSLNAMTWQHPLQAAVVGTHDSCLPVPVLAMDSMQWYQPYELRFQIALPADPTKDRFERHRKTQYGHNVLLGAFLCGREDAQERVMSLPERTRLRLEAEKRKLLRRRRGRPFKV